MYNQLNSHRILLKYIHLPEASEFYCGHYSLHSYAYANHMTDFTKLQLVVLLVLKLKKSKKLNLVKIAFKSKNQV